MYLDKKSRRKEKEGGREFNIKNTYRERESDDETEVKKCLNYVLDSVTGQEADLIGEYIPTYLRSRRF